MVSGARCLRLFGTAGGEFGPASRVGSSERDERGIEGVRRRAIAAWIMFRVSIRSSERKAAFMYRDGVAGRRSGWMALAAGTAERSVHVHTVVRIWATKALWLRFSKDLDCW